MTVSMMQCGTATTEPAFEIIALAATNATLKSGDLMLDDGRELTLTDDLTIDLTTVLGGAASGNTTYYLYVDMQGVPASSVNGTTNKTSIVITDESSFALLTTAPEDTGSHSDAVVGAR